MPLLTPFFLLIGVFAAFFAQLILHETGHLLFGLATGYRFCSFRIFHTLWIREDGRIRRKRFSLPGTGGQCLMAPPEMRAGRFPVILYNLGGVLMNLLSAAVFLLLYFLCRSLWRHLFLLPMLFLFLAFLGVYFAIANGIPLRLGMVENDGYNTLILSQKEAARSAFWVQLKIHEQISRGRRLREMPPSWFALPASSPLDNSLTAAVAVFACNRLMDEGRFAEADAHMARLLEGDAAMAGLHRKLLVCDRIFCLLLAGKKEEAARLSTPALRKFRSAMKDSPATLRTEYTLALLLEENREKAAMIRLRFAKAAGKYPYAGELRLEQELIAAAETVAYPVQTMTEFGKMR